MRRRRVASGDGCGAGRRPRARAADRRRVRPPSRSRACWRSGPPTRVRSPTTIRSPRASAARARRSSTCCRRSPRCTPRTTIPPGRSTSSAIAVRRWIEEQTFVPDPDDGSGVHLLDDQAARYGDFDDVAIVGLVDSDWPERPRRNIFYPPALLKSLGWPSEKDRRARRRRAVPRSADVGVAPRRRSRPSRSTTRRSSSRSMQLDEIPRARLSTVAREPFDDARVFADEALSLEPVALRAVCRATRGAGRRCGRTRSPADAPDFHGTVARPAAARLVGQRDRNLSRLPVQVLRAARAQARGRARRRGGDGSAAPGAVRPRGVRALLRAWQDAAAIAR